MYGALKALHNMEPHVSIIILNWNGWQDTIECLESVLKLEYSNFQVLLIDNGSSDGSINQIASWAEGKLHYTIQSRFPDIINPAEEKPIKYCIMDISDYGNIAKDTYCAKLLIIKSNRNFGFAMANNKGMGIASHLFKSSYYFLLNNDTVIKKDALSNLISMLEKDKSIGAVQSTIYNYYKPQITDNAGGIILFWGQT